jgi:hypothetical protein
VLQWFLEEQILGLQGAVCLLPEQVVELMEDWLVH